MGQTDGLDGALEKKSSAWDSETGTETEPRADEAGGEGRDQAGVQFGGVVVAGRGRRVLALGLADGLRAALEEGDEEAARIALKALKGLIERYHRRLQA